MECSQSVYDGQYGTCLSIAMVLMGLPGMEKLQSFDPDAFLSSLQSA